jgi:hypothetical protein
MIEQTYYLDMIPGESAPPVVHVSQFDVNSRTLTFNLMKGGVAYEPDVGMTVTLDGTKPDNTAFSYPMTVDGSSVSIALQTQMTVVSGHVRCEVTVSNASGQIGSANFILAVEECAIDIGAISDTDIPIFEDLKNQAQQAAAEASASAQTAEEASEAVSAILPASAGTTGQVLTKTPTGADWQTSIASGVQYDNTQSGLTANTVQGAVDENASAISSLLAGLTPVFLTGLTTSNTGAVSLGISPSNHYITTPLVTNMGDAYCVVFINSGNYTIRVRSRLDDTPIANTSVNVKFMKY